MGRLDETRPGDLTKKDIPGIVVALLVAALMIWGDAWPEYRRVASTIIAIIAGGLVAIFAVYFCVAVYEPSNSDRIKTSRIGMTITRREGSVEVIPWSDVTRVHLVRDESAFPDFQFGYHTETEWVITSANGVKLLGDSWLARWKLYWAFSLYLPRFDSRLARSGLHSWRKAQWVCYERQ